MQFQQPSIVTPAASPAPINHSSTTNLTTTAQPTSVAQPPTVTQPTASASGPPSRRVRSILVMYLTLADYSQQSCT
eukprot:1200938-Pleurochrysis_carterae.AAC.1